MDGPWRISADPKGVRVEFHHLAGFDELVVADWFHLERMNTSAWWMRVGEKTFDIFRAKDGTITIREQSR